MPDILIIDDDSDLLELVTIIVRNMGMQAVATEYGAEAIPLLKSQHFDLVLMDIYLGTHDGRAIAKEMRENPNWKDLPILLYSASDRITPESIIESGANSFLKKPFDVKVLIAEIEKLVNR